MSSVLRIPVPDGGCHRVSHGNGGAAIRQMTTTAAGFPRSCPSFPNASGSSLLPLAAIHPRRREFDHGMPGNHGREIFRAVVFGGLALHGSMGSVRMALT